MNNKLTKTRTKNLFFFKKDSIIVKELKLKSNLQFQKLKNDLDYDSVLFMEFIEKIISNRGLPHKTVFLDVIIDNSADVGVNLFIF